ncbi:MAG: hypothetical protein KAT34_04080 [Candidatus Aminicenantes bacterium]|nr:hypothetical protein [Candidatus Aminicenantes bacterium]
MNHKKKEHHGISFVGIILVLLGVVWVLSNLDIIDFSFGTWWPLILVAVGLINLLSMRSANNPSAWILIALGVVFLLTTHDVFEWSDIWKFWPIILVIIGISLLFRREGKPVRGASDEDRFDETAIFWGFEKNITGKSFKGGTITAIFGGGEIDLRSAELDKDGAVIDITAIFGGVELRIPESWAVETHTTGIFGGADNKCKNREQREGQRVVINATAIFGGVDIKN